MISITYDDYEIMERFAKNDKRELPLKENLSKIELESLFSGDINQDPQTGYSKDVVQFLLFILAKIEQSENPKKWEDTTKNINHVMNKYIELID